MIDKKDAIFACEDLHVSIEDKEIVKGVSLAIGAGEKHAFMGPNGSGKSSMANAMMGHPSYTITSGKVFLKGEDIDFQDISEFRLRGYQSFLRMTRDVTERTVVNHLVVIRTIFNLAIRDGLVDRKHYPFGKGKIVIKFPESVKIGLEAQEVIKLENLKLKRGSPRWHALNVWLFSFYFAGMRVSDVLRLSWSDFQNDRMFYRMGKNNKAGSLKIPEKAQKILDEYLDRREKPDDTIFPELRRIDAKNYYRVLKTINNADKKFNKHLVEIAELAGISKPLTMHIARHTFGNISGENIPLQMLQKLYRHTSITTTINYQSNFAFKDADEALDTVVNFGFTLSE